MSTTRRKLLLWFVIATICVVADRLLKSYAISVWSRSPLELGFGFGFTFLLNPGIAFSIPFGGTLLLAVTGAVLTLFCWLLWRAVQTRNIGTALACLTVLAGAGSNIADRFLYGGVIDYVSLGSLSVINLADLLVLSGVLLLLFPFDLPSRRSGTISE